MKNKLYAILMYGALSLSMAVPTFADVTDKTTIKVPGSKLKAYTKLLRSTDLSKLVKIIAY